MSECPACQRVTVRAVNVSQISPSRSCGGEMEHAGTAGRTPLVLPVSCQAANEACLGQDEDSSEMTKRPEARRGAPGAFMIGTSDLTDCATNDIYVQKDASVSEVGTKRGPASARQTCSTGHSGTCQPLNDSDFA